MLTASTLIQKDNLGFSMYEHPVLVLQGTLLGLGHQTVSDVSLNYSHKFTVWLAIKSQQE